MALSSNSIIHFTKDKKSLEGILLNCFKVHYCREIIHARTGRFDFLTPIVSFSDIPFSQLSEHIKNYGSYGIGMKKKWAEEKGLNPVLYVEKKSNFGHNFFAHLSKWVANDKGKISEWALETKYIFDVVRYMKNYEGVLVRRNKPLVKNYRFSDEREWRYVIQPMEKIPFIANCGLVKNEDSILKKKLELNLLIKDFRLEFQPDDINYIIIKRDSERDSIIKTLERVKSGYNQAQIKRLTSRIISSEQIKTDF